VFPIKAPSFPLDRPDEPEHLLPVSLWRRIWEVHVPPLLEGDEPAVRPDTGCERCDWLTRTWGFRSYLATVRQERRAVRHSEQSTTEGNC